MLGWELFWSDTSLVDECDDTDHVSEGLVQHLEVLGRSRSNVSMSSVLGSKDSSDSIEEELYFMEFRRVYTNLFGCSKVML